MVRHDPANQRGPIPPNGPPEVSDKKQKLVFVDTLFELSTEEEYNKLWNHILYGTKTCIRMLKGYTDLGMPGEPLESLIDLRDELQKLIERHEKL